MNKSPAYQRYSKDYLSSVRVQMMTLAEEGAYNRLLEFCWINGSIPVDEKQIARLVGKGCSIEIATICKEMFLPHPNDPTKLIHDRLEEEREKQEHNSAMRKQASEARWNKQGKPQKAGQNASGKQAKSTTDANALQTDMQNHPLHTSSSSSSSIANTNTSKKNSAGARFDSENLVNSELKTELEETLQWLREKKNLNRLSITEWESLIADLAIEEIDLGEFKQFYTWVEKLDWTNVISPNLLRGQVEAWKNRETLEAKKQLHKQNGNGKPRELTSEEIKQADKEFYAERFGRTV